SIAHTTSHNDRPACAVELGSCVSVLKIRSREGRRWTGAWQPEAPCAREVSVRRIRYAVAMSLDGYIAGPKGEADWIIMDPDIDFSALFQQFDTLFLGRHTFEALARCGNPGMPGMKTFV